MKNTTKLFFIFTFLLTAIFTFSKNISAQTKNEVLIVADQRTRCLEPTFNKLCLQVKRLNEENFTKIAQEIENFKFIPGYFYVLDVRVDTLRNPPADASNLKYRLRKILARVKSGNDSMPIPDEPGFSGTEWKLTAIDGNAVESSRAFIKFDEQNKRAGGNGGCNAFGGTLTKNGNQIKISQVISTKMYCQQGSDIENSFFRNLDRVTKYDIRGNKLLLISGNTTVLEFEAKK